MGVAVSFSKSLLILTIMFISSGAASKAKPRILKWTLTIKKKKRKVRQLTNLKAGVYKPNKDIYEWMQPVGYQF